MKFLCISLRIVIRFKFFSFQFAELSVSFRISFGIDFLVGISLSCWKLFSSIKWSWIFHSCVRIKCQKADSVWEWSLFTNWLHFKLSRQASCCYMEGSMCARIQGPHLHWLTNILQFIFLSVGKNKLYLPPHHHGRLKPIFLVDIGVERRIGELNSVYRFSQLSLCPNPIIPGVSESRVYVEFCNAQLSLPICFSSQYSYIYFGSTDMCWNILLLMTLPPFSLFYGGKWIFFWFFIAKGP